jgi:hypothetical protein
MRDYGLGSYDAVHAATAAFVEVPDFATLDAKFAALPPTHLTLYVNESRVPYCRGIRARL